MDSSCLFSIVRNISGKKMVFPILPPHGRELAKDEEYAIWGSALEAVGRGDRFGARFPKGFEQELLQCRLEIVTLPKPILMDEVTEATKQVTLQGGSLILEDPCVFCSVSESESESA